jgi:hypothetical protein
MTQMTKRTADRPADTVAPTPGVGSPAQSGLHINPATGLCSDYLNHFNEAIMVLEMLPAVPDCVDDFFAWRPCSYSEHFAGSNFKNREAVIAAYQAADPAIRKSLDALADSMNVMLLATREAMKPGPAASSADALANCAVAWLKPLVARAGIVINGTGAVKVRKNESSAAQAAVDALFP